MRLREPAYPFPAAPLADSLRVRPQVYLDAVPVLLILLPAAFVLFQIGVGHGTLTVLAPLLELALVGLSILPDFRAVSFHVGIPKVARIGLLQVGKIVGALALENALSKVALVVAAIGPSVLAKAVFLRVFELPDVL